MIPNVTESSFYKIQEGTKNEFVSRGSHGDVLRWGDTGGLEQIWLLIPASELKCKIQCRLTGEFITVNSAGDIFCAPESGLPEQEFSFVNYNNGWWNIQESTKNEFMAVSWTNGGILRWAETNDRDQRFKLIPVDRKHKPKLEEGEAEPGMIGDAPRITSYSMVPPERSASQLIGEALIPAVFVNDKSYSDHRNQVLQNPYYILRREQYWDRSQGRGIYYQHDGYREIKKEITVEYGISKTFAKKVEEILGWKFSISGKLGFEKHALALSSSLSRSIKTTTSTEIKIESSEKKTKKVILPSKRFAYAEYIIVDRYRLFDRNKHVVYEWEVVLDGTIISDGFEEPESVINEGNYQFMHKYSDKYLCTGEVDNGGHVHLWGPIPKGHEDRYSFNLRTAGDGYYYLVHKYSGKYICTGAKENGGPVHLWGPIPSGHEDRYKFSLSPAGDDYYYLIHKYSGKYVCTGAVNNGGSVHLWGPIPTGHEDRYKFKLSSI